MSSKNDALRAQAADRRESSSHKSSSLPQRLLAGLALRSIPTFRRPTDVILLILGLFALLVALLIFLSTKGFLGIVQVLFAVAGLVPSRLAELWRRTLQVGAFGTVLTALLLATLFRRWLLVRNLLFGGIVTWFLTGAIGFFLAPRLGPGLPSGDLALLVAVITMADAYLEGAWRALGWALVVLVALAEFLVGQVPLIALVGGFGLGVILGAGANLVLGVRREDLSIRVIKQAFGARELVLKSIKPVRADARGSVPYFAQAADGQEYFIKLVGPEQRNADFLFKLWRTLLFKNPGSSTPFLTPAQQIEHEAYLTLLAQRQGVRTPDIEFTTHLEDNFALEAQKKVVGLELTALDSAQISGSLLAQIWQQVGLLHQARIYHGDLRLANILVDQARQPWVIDFGFGSADADEAALAQDTAQLLASLAYVVGAERAVVSARNVLGPEPLIEALPHLQPLALSSATREELKQDPELLEEIEEEIKQEAGSPPEEPESIFRVQRRDLLWLLGLGIGVYVFLPQLGELNKIIDAWWTARPEWLVLGLACSALTYAVAPFPTSAVLQKGIDWWHFFVAQFAATFANRLGPQGIGGAFVLERFLEKSGIDRPGALTAITVSMAAGGLVHVLLTIAALAALGLGTAPLFKQIKLWQVGIAIAIVLVIVIFLWRSPDRLRGIVKSLRESARGLFRVAQDPRRGLELFGGSFVITATDIATLYISLIAVGARVSLLDAAAVFLAGSIIGQASPTPGGLGVIEGAFAAGLTVLGVATNQAVAGVLLYRLLTFWLPIIPGVFAFRRLKSQDRI